MENKDINKKNKNSISNQNKEKTNNQKKNINKKKNIENRDSNLKKTLKEESKVKSNINKNKENNKKSSNNKKNLDYKNNKKNKRNNKKVEEEETLIKKKQVDTLIDENNFVPKKKLKLKKKFKIIIGIALIILLISLILFMINWFKDYQIKKEYEQLLKEQENLVKEINSHYNNYVKTNEDTILYRKDENGNYYEYGMAYNDVEFNLSELEINHLTEYFYSMDLDAYIKYSSLEPIDELSEYDKRYKNYIVFNENIVTKNEFTLYNNDKEVYSFKESMRFPIIIKNDNGKYYVEFNNRLLYILKDDIKEIVKSNNTNNKNATKVTTLCYHRIYDTNEKCNDLYICKSKSNFEREMKYLSDNKFLTLTMEEMYLYLTKKIQVPKKSVVLTFDDGYLFTNGIKILEKYNLHGTGFIKTGAFSDYSIFDSPNFEIQSHTDHMHVAGTCPRENANQQGGGILCLAESKVLNDLKNSREKLNGAIALAYPFYDYNTRAVNLVKKAGFKLAFIGAAGKIGRATPGINPLLIPRITIWNTTSFNTFKSYVNN